MKKSDYKLTTLIDDTLRLMRTHDGRNRLASTEFLWNQQVANHAIPRLMERDTDLRIALVNPLDELVDLTKIALPRIRGTMRPNWTTTQELCFMNALNGKVVTREGEPFIATRRCRVVNWVVCGSDPELNPQPIHPDWVRSLQQQCQLNRVPFYFTGWGPWLPWTEMPPALKEECYKPLPEFETDLSKAHLKPHRFLFTYGTTGVGCSFYNVGLEKTNRLLGGREYIEVPSPR